MYWSKFIFVFALPFIAVMFDGCGDDDEKKAPKTTSTAETTETEAESAAKKKEAEHQQEMTRIQALLAQKDQKVAELAAQAAAAASKPPPSESGGSKSINPHNRQHDPASRIRACFQVKKKLRNSNYDNADVIETRERELGKGVETILKNPIKIFDKHPYYVCVDKNDKFAVLVIEKETKAAARPVAAGERGRDEEEGEEEEESEMGGLSSPHSAGAIGDAEKQAIAKAITEIRQGSWAKFEEIWVPAKFSKIKEKVTVNQKTKQFTLKVFGKTVDLKKGGGKYRQASVDIDENYS